MKICHAVFATVSMVLIAWAAPTSAEPFALGAPDQCTPLRMSEPVDSGSSSQSYCEARCLDGSVRTSNCSGTCQATNQACTSSGVTGGIVICSSVVVGSCSSFPCVSCEAYKNMPCSEPLGTEVACYTAGGQQGLCSCGHKWICNL